MLNQTERRAKARFPIELSVSYCSRSRSQPLSGNGRTLNISSAGLLIAAENRFREGLRLQLTLDWPWLLDNAIPIRLVAESRVVRSNESCFAVELESYQFRTGKRQSQSANLQSWSPQPQGAMATSSVTDA